MVVEKWPDVVASGRELTKSLDQVSSGRSTRTLPEHRRVRNNTTAMTSTFTYDLCRMVQGVLDESGIEIVKIGMTWLVMLAIRLRVKVPIFPQTPQSWTNLNPITPTTF